MTAETLSQTILALFAERDAARVETPVLQPADPFLDMAGEDLRRRIFLTESETGEALCLRPEWTIPVCLDHIRNRADTPRRYAYMGEVFRQRREGGHEFLQAGIEDLGEPDAAAADARSVADAFALLARALPNQALSVTLGDQAVFEAVLGGFGLPRGWQRRLVRAFGAPDQLSAVLADLADPARRGLLSDGIGEQIASSDLKTIATLLESEMQAAGFSPHAGRTPEEIARRLLEKAELASFHLKPEALEALTIFLGIDVALERAVDALHAFGRGAGLDLDGALDGFARRAEAVAGFGLPQGAVRYDAAFGRPLDYYTGLVFEIAATGQPKPLAGGGRYDRLLTLLGAEAPIAGVGFSVWLDRVAALAGGERAQS
ncbi:MAG TPA: ATP phosphoribosyltransferase regulatory subunit [Mesorhizobium sp.]|jgi:ATP phosphoribosyltransferase regulatory subunit|nr:ATP phosphoribosyltransferase regulatory subunit [Mesorhizobium sp.]